ncbi:hypothetical protein DL96DRAFT_1607036 [Flagelloscypha sp. PMI_526]|nr:hypothetical protein DL96DRAFT_1607036 [Flagelloscypha sp. PMI_526]
MHSIRFFLLMAFTIAGLASGAPLFKSKGGALNAGLEGANLLCTFLPNLCAPPVGGGSGVLPDPGQSGGSSVPEESGDSNVPSDEPGNTDPTAALPVVGTPTSKIHLGPGIVIHPTQSAEDST